jgi:hypothetical protein
MSEAHDTCKEVLLKEQPNLSQYGTSESTGTLCHALGLPVGLLEIHSAPSEAPAMHSRAEPHEI